MGVTDKSVRRRHGARAVALLVLTGTVWTGPLDVPATAHRLVPATAAPVSAEEQALRTARTTGRRVELPDARTETRQIFAEPSGQLTLVQHAMPVRVRRDGAWHPIDTTLRHRADGTIAPVATSVDLTLSGGGRAPLLTLAAGEHRLSLSWPLDLRTPVLTADTATYSEVLPGVDLTVTATVDGYRQRLVVKDRAAAANPALRRITFHTATTGLTLHPAPDGSLTAVDGDSAPVFVAGAPTMWDAPARTGPARSAVGEDDDIAARQRPVQLDVAPGKLTIVPDATLLDDPSADFPIVIDPDFGSGAAAWLHLNLNAPNQNGWGWDQASGAKVGRTWNNTPVYRSFFQFNLNSIGGAVVSAAYFRITLDHSASCSPTPVELWHTGGIRNGTTWANTGNGHWYRQLDTRSANANDAGGCGTVQPDVGMEFGGANLNSVMQAAATEHWGGVTLGLKAPNEGDQYQWKKFHPGTAVLQVTYNHRPNPPAELSTVPPTTCGTATAPTPLNTPTPTFTTRVTDPNLHTINARLQIREGTTVRYDVTSPNVGSGSVLHWPAPAADTLPGDQPQRVFSYQAAATDQLGLGTDWGAPCYFTVDRQVPGTPVVQTADFPDGEPVRAVGETGTLQLSPGTGPTGQADPDIAGYRYGFQQDRLTGWAPADQAGRATIPMVLWQTSRPLYVQAVDKAGNPSTNETPCICTVWDLRANPSPATPAHKSADLTGDGRADIATLFDMGHGRTAAWNAVARPDGGVHAPYIGWDSGINGGFAGYRTKSSQGDFDGDGLADLAVFREDPDRRLRLFLLRSDSHRYDADPAPEWEGPVGSTEWTLSNLQLVVTDVNRDTRADLVALVPHGPAHFSFFVFPGAPTGLATPVNWYTNPVNYAEVARVRIVAGDFNGDGFGDIGNFYNYDNGLTKLWLHYSNGSNTFTMGVQVWDSGVGNWEWGRSTPTVGDYNGDNRADIVLMYNYDLFGNAGLTRFWMFPGTTAGPTTPSLWWDSGGWNTFHAGRAQLSTGDFDNNGRSDIAAIYDATSPTARIHLFHTKPTGDGFQAPDLGAPHWTGRIGAVNSTFQPEAGRGYWLRSRLSGKCLQLRGGSSTVGTVIEQATCAAGQTQQLFRFEQVDNGPHHQIRPLPDRCVGVNNATHNDNEAVLNQACQDSGGNQQWRFEHLAGQGLDSIVRPRAAHSDKCIGISGAVATDGAPAVQQPCSGTHTEYLIQIRP